MTIFDRPPKVEFYSVDEARTALYPIEPMTSVPMPWIADSKAFYLEKRKGKASSVTAAHMCSGIGQLMSTGYVVRTLYDIVITTNGDGVAFGWQTPSAECTVDYFEAEQFGDFAPIPPQTLRTVLKIFTPWRVSLPDGWGLLMMPISYGEKQPFSSSTGILDPRLSRELNLIVYWHELNGEVLVKAGTPICQLIPVRLNTPNMIVRPATEKEKHLNDVMKFARRATFRRLTNQVATRIHKHVLSGKCPFHKK